MGQDSDDDDDDDDYDDDDREKRGRVNRITGICPDGLQENCVTLCTYRQFLSVLQNAN
jgi:hypothetical protein